jgi:hypothetical protein
VIRLLLPGILLLGSPFAQNLPAREITRIAATPKQLIISGVAEAGSKKIVELAPCDSLDQSTNAPVVAEVRFAGKFTVAIDRFDGPRDRIYSGFDFDRLVGSTNRPTTHYVDEWRSVARYDESFPAAASKKGLQVQMVDDALALGIKHAALNVDLARMIDLSGDTNGLCWQMDGQSYLFRLDYMESLDRQVKPLSDARVVVSFILLYYQSGHAVLDRIMLHPQYDSESPHRLSAFNTATPDGLRYFKACLEFLADRYSRLDRAHGRVANFIVGNEVNSHWFWCNMGHVPMETFADDYLRTVRVVHTAIRKFSRTARVYVSLEHHWNIHYPGGDQTQTFPGRAFLDYFNRRAKAGGDFDWHLAFHPYPENLFEPRTWNDKSATASDDTPRITFRNLELLPRYLRRSEFLNHGQPRRIILSEQGFHTPDTPDGETVQAAAYCYAYYKTAHLDGIDAFIYHRHVDHQFEGGLRLGLWRRDEKSVSASEPATQKRIYEVFRRADTPEWEKAFEFALPVIGVRRWSETLSDGSKPSL